MLFSQPKCPNCQNNRFVEQRVDPVDARFKITILKCSSCGTAISAWPHPEIREISQKLDVLLKKLGARFP
jgi:transcription elongation factor Elf1